MRNPNLKLVVFNYAKNYQKKLRQNMLDRGSIYIIHVLLTVDKPVSSVILMLVIITLKLVDYIT